MSEPQAPGEPLLVGQVLEGRLEIRELVGRGGMGAVYRARHLEWNADLAVKVPEKALLAERVTRERWILEAHTWVDLGLHPNIVPCYFIRDLDHVPLLFLDFLRGGSLKEWIDARVESPHDWGTCIDLAIQACDGLTHAHSRGIVHRDIKPANLLLDGRGRLCVTDFGLVKVRGGTEIDMPAQSVTEVQARWATQIPEHSLGLTTTGTVLGTPHYASPEQWMGDQVGPLADVYGLGVVFYELFCGRRPFDPEDGPMAFMELLTAHLHTAPPDPCQLNPRLHPQLAEILVRCIAKEPSDRPQSAMHLREELARVYQQVVGKPYPRPIPRVGSERADALNNKAVSLWSLGKTLEAYDVWAEATKLDALHPETEFNRSLLQWEQGSIEGAEVVRRLAMARTSSPRAGTYLGFFHLLDGSAAEAERILREAVAQPEVADDGSAWRALGDSLLSQERYAEAEASYREAQQRIPEDPETRLRLSLATAHERRHEGRLLFPSTHPQGRCATSGLVSAMVVGDGFAVVASPGKIAKINLADGRELWSVACHEKVERLGLTAVHVVSLQTPSGSVWQLSDGQCLLQLPNQERFFALLAGGKAALAGLVDLRAVTLPDGQKGRRYGGHESQINVAVVSPNGRLAVTGGCDRSLRVWELATGECRQVLEGHRDHITALALSKDMGTLFSGGRDGSLRAWSLADKRSLLNQTGLGGAVESLQLTEDGNYLVAGLAGDEGRINVWCTRSWTCQFAGPGHPQLASGRNWMSTTANPPELAQLRSVPEGACLRRFRGPGLSNLVACDLKGDRLLIAEGASVSWYELGPVGVDLSRALAITRSSSHAESDEARNQFLVHLECARRNREAGQDRATCRELEQARAIPGYNRDPQLLDLNASMIGSFPRRGLRALWEAKRVPMVGSVEAMVISDDGHWAAIAQQRDIRLWDLQLGTQVGSLSGHRASVGCLAMTPDGKFLVSGSQDRSLRVWQRASGECLAVLPNHPEALSAVTISPDGRWVAAVSSVAPKTWVYDRETQKRLELESGSARNLGWGDARVVVAGDGAQGPLTVWDPLQGSRLREMALHFPAYTMATGAGVAVLANDQGDVEVWDLQRQSGRTLEGHSGKVHLGLTSDGLYAVGASFDRQMSVWEISSGVRVKSVTSPSGPFLRLAGTASGRYLLTATAEFLSLWELDWIVGGSNEESGVQQPPARPGFFQRLRRMFSSRSKS